MDIPTWLIEILRQFPMVVVIGWAIWYAEKRVREKEIRLEQRYDQNWKEAAEREDKLRVEARQDRDAEVQRLREAHDKALASKDEQIANLTEEVKKLGTQVAALAKKLQG
jgi:hypothetical protein